MLKCTKEYKRHAARYQAGEEYDISREKADADEAYFGEKLWEEAKKAPAKKASAKKSK